MAGDWLKMDCSTPDKPEVLAITTAMGWDDPDMTVGKLFRVWRWFDQHTTDGNAAGVTAALLDRIAGVSGFAQAMQNVRWLIVSADGLQLPSFEKHNGATAKSRAQTAKRVSNHRASGESNADSNAASVTQALAREEKRREEKKEINTTPAVAAFVPPEWIPSETWKAYLKTRTKKRSDNNPHALGLIVQDLERFKSLGHDPLAILETSIKSGWAGVFEPRPQQGGVGKQAALEARNRAVMQEFLAGGL